MIVPLHNVMLSCCLLHTSLDLMHAHMHIFMFAHTGSVACVSHHHSHSSSTTITKTHSLTYVHSHLCTQGLWRVSATIPHTAAALPSQAAPTTANQGGPLYQKLPTSTSGAKASKLDTTAQVCVCVLRIHVLWVCVCCKSQIAVTGVVIGDSA